MHQYNDLVCVYEVIVSAKPMCSLTNNVLRETWQCYTMHLVFIVRKLTSNLGPREISIMHQ
jgi:hypothetical protein